MVILFCNLFLVIFVTLFTHKCNVQLSLSIILQRIEGHVRCTHNWCRQAAVSGVASACHVAGAGAKATVEQQVLFEIKCAVVIRSKLLMITRLNVSVIINYDIVM